MEVQRAHQLVSLSYLLVFQLIESVFVVAQRKRVIKLNDVCPERIF